MGRGIFKLSARSVETLTKPGWYGDGGGLGLRIFPNGSKRWVFRWERNNQRREMGFGPVASVSLSTARRKAEEARELLAAGGDPMEAKREREEAATAAVDEARAKSATPTFGEYANTYIESQRAGWRTVKHHVHWRATIENHAKNLLDMPVDAITTEDVLEALQPIWLTISPTAGILRGRIETILDAAKANKLIAAPWENPARWRGNLLHLLPRQKRKYGVRHHPAVPYQDVPKFYARLVERPATAARALQMIILCATRTAETRLATWREFNMIDRIWTIPGHRIKAGREHRIPLTESCMEILREQAALTKPRPDGYVFPGCTPGRPLHQMAVLMLLRRMKMAQFTVHGFRSSFRDYMGDMTDHQESVVEMALAHQVGDETVRAYRRGDAFRKRTIMMADWENYLISRLTAEKETADEIEDVGLSKPRRGPRPASRDKVHGGSEAGSKKPEAELFRVGCEQPVEVSGNPNTRLLQPCVELGPMLIRVGPR
ncbi:MAG: integrase arm-type DNA-binding domain-containing protein [Sphingomonadales bacterium]|nr:integrase arm-type DNA-binding domain-containing protein [Sphingomonadales bacterium]